MPAHIEVPKTLTCEELINSFNEGLGLGLDVSDTESFSFKCDTTKDQIQGEKTLEAIGLLDGARVELIEK